MSDDEWYASLTEEQRKACRILTDHKQGISTYSCRREDAHLFPHDVPRVASPDYVVDDFPGLREQLDGMEMWPSDTIDDDGERLPEINLITIVDALSAALANEITGFYAGKRLDPLHIERLGAALAGAIQNAQEA